MRRLLHNRAILWLCPLAARFISMEFIRLWMSGNLARGVIMNLLRPRRRDHWK